jgi:hypothetical protein
MAFIDVPLSVPFLLGHSYELMENCLEIELFEMEQESLLPFD